MASLLCDKTQRGFWSTTSTSCQGTKGGASIVRFPEKSTAKNGGMRPSLSRLFRRRIPLKERLVSYLSCFTHPYTLDREYVARMLLRAARRIRPFDPNPVS